MDIPLAAGVMRIIVTQFGFYMELPVLFRHGANILTIQNLNNLSIVIQRLYAVMTEHTG